MYNQNSGYGQAMMNRIYSAASSACPTFGRIFIVLSPSDSADANFEKLSQLIKPDPMGQVRLFTSLESAYAAATSNNDDVILLSGHSEHTIEAALDWSKSRVHLLGMDGGGRKVLQGSRVTTTGNPADAYVMKVTGTRNTFQNVKFEQNSTNAAAITVLRFGGEGTVCKNVTATFSTATNIDGSETTSYEVVMGEDSGTFIDCSFGTETLVTTGARAVMSIDQVKSGQQMKSCRFINCEWLIASTSADANFIRVIATTDLMFSQVFVNPVFFATINATMVAITLTDAVDSVASLVQGNMLFVNPATNATNFCSAITDNVKVVGPGMSLDGGAAAVGSTLGIGVIPA